MENQTPCERPAPDWAAITLECLPADLRTILLSLKESLVVQGCVQMRMERRSRPFYRLRYRIRDPNTDKMLHRSIALGDSKTVADGVRELLEIWRRQPREAAVKSADTSRTADEGQGGTIAEKGFTDAAQCLRAAVKDGMPRSRPRNRLLKDIDTIVRQGTPRDLLAFTTSMGTRVREQSKPGRPARLCW